ncbi:LysR family transcriptional regulator [Shewanella gaetbuli]
MNFSLEQLAAYVSVYEERSFSKAALKLDKHRTTVGQVIANLEDQVAVTLFERNPRNVEPTENAHLLYRYAKQALEQSKAFDRVALSLSFGELECINIAYSSFLPHLALSIIREQLLEDYPNMRVNFLVRTQEEIREGLKNEQLQFGIVNINSANAMSNIDYQLLGNMPFSPYASKHSDLAHVNEKDVFTALKNSRQFVLKSLVDEGLGNKVILSANYDLIDQLALAIKFTQRGFGWLLMPTNLETKGYIAEHLTELKCDQIRDGITLPVGLWCIESKPILEIKKSVVMGVNRYISLIKRK